MSDGVRDDKKNEKRSSSQEDVVVVAPPSSSSSLWMLLAFPSRQGVGVVSVDWERLEPGTLRQARPVVNRGRKGMTGQGRKKGGECKFGGRELWGVCKGDLVLGLGGKARTGEPWS